jgi:hypothetical protein
MVSFYVNYACLKSLSPNKLLHSRELGIQPMYVFWWHNSGHKRVNPLGKGTCWTLFRALIGLLCSPKHPSFQAQMNNCLSPALAHACVHCTAPWQ